MKTLSEINADIENARAQIEVIRKENGKGETGLVNKIKTCEKARNYLELSPTIDSIKKQLEDLNKWLKIHEDRFLAWLEQDPKRKNISNPKEVFNEQTETDLNEIKKWKQEKKFINYLLS